VADAPRDEAFWEEVQERITTLLHGEDGRLVLRAGAVRIDRDTQTIRISAAAARLADVTAYLTRLSTPERNQEETP
jgi:hypothetical protein